MFLLSLYIVNLLLLSGMNLLNMPQLDSGYGWLFVKLKHARNVKLLSPMKIGFLSLCAESLQDLRRVNSTSSMKFWIVPALGGVAKILCIRYWNLPVLICVSSAMFI